MIAFGTHHHVYGPGVLPVWASDLLAWCICVPLVLGFSYICYGTVRCNARTGRHRRCWGLQVYNGYRNGKMMCEYHRDHDEWREDGTAS